MVMAMLLRTPTAMHSEKASLKVLASGKYLHVVSVIANQLVVLKALVLAKLILDPLVALLDEPELQMLSDLVLVAMNKLVVRSNYCSVSHLLLDLL